MYHNFFSASKNFYMLGTETWALSLVRKFVVALVRVLRMCVRMRMSSFLVLKALGSSQFTQSSLRITFLFSLIFLWKLHTCVLLSSLVSAATSLLYLLCGSGAFEKRLMGLWHLSHLNAFDAVSPLAKFMCNSHIHALSAIRINFLFSFVCELTFDPFLHKPSWYNAPANLKSNCT